MTVEQKEVDERDRLGDKIMCMCLGGRKERNRCEG